MTPIIMPQIGQDITRGAIVAWLKGENEPVHKGEAILTVESEKASFDVEADADGVLIRILFPAGAEVEVLKPVGYIGTPGEAIFDLGKGSPEGPERALPPRERAYGVSPAPSRRPRASPSARRLAAEADIELGCLTGTGPGGRVLKRDVLAASRQSSGAPADRFVPFSRTRRVIADRLTQLSATIPHYYLFADVDMERVLAWRKGYNGRTGEHVTVTDLAVWAAAKALREHPDMNAHVRQDGVLLLAGVHIGLAVAAKDGLLVPVVRDADSLDIGELSRAVRRLAGQARSGKVAPEPAGTFTVTSLGMFGVTRFLPVINPPECGILAVGAVEPRVVFREGEIAPRACMSLSLACDHRAVDGASAAAFLGRLKETLEEQTP